MRKPIVLGEEVSVLQQFISGMEVQQKRDGTYKVTSQAMPSEVAVPFMRR